MQAASPGETGALASWVHQRSINLFGWLEWIVKNNLPLNFCESEEARRLVACRFLHMYTLLQLSYTKLDPICVETLCWSLHKVARTAEAKLAAEMPDQFWLIIDRWTHGSDHYLTVFGCYMVGSTPSYSLLAMAPLLNKPGDDHSAETHRVFLQEMLRMDYGKDIGKCAFIVGDNCSVKRRLAGLLHVPLVGCASHRLNLAMEGILEESYQDLGSVQALVIKLRSLNQAAKLRLKMSLRPVIRQEIRWSSTFMMLDRNLKLLEFVKDDADVEDALPTRAENRRLKALHAELTNVESVTKAL
ncbi:hypothetical protein PC128_g21617 [Phytophthora cactorum]|nr:hypothetical protein PC128_g21617 [Phytophthora cactorum]KAG4038678.1 hypothetical protein PC123_g25760 [Phytophthora cactorum]